MLNYFIHSIQSEFFNFLITSTLYPIYFHNFSIQNRTYVITDGVKIYLVISPELLHNFLRIS